MFTVGVISDTHGLLRPEALDALIGSDAIVHAGDVGRPEILERLAALAPVTAVRGNVDVKPWAESLPITAAAEFAGTRLYVIHDRADLARYPVPAGTNIVIFGHSHKAFAEWRDDGVLWFNPGSAGPRRFRLPASVGLIRLDGVSVEPQILSLLS
jgi:putative phosphoesterase